MAGKGIQPSTGGRQKNTRSSPAKGGRASVQGSPQTVRQQAIPDAVARRIAIATGLPTLMGMAVFVASYVLVSRSILDIPPVATLLTSGACFLLGLVGLSYGVLSASWEESPGTLLGTEQLGTNLKRLGDSVRTSRQERSDRPHG